MAIFFRPRSLDSLAGYDLHAFVSDLGAGVTVAIIALPLAMAFAIASGVRPEQGLFTAIVAGFLIGEALVVGLTEAVVSMRAAMDRGRTRAQP